MDVEGKCVGGRGDGDFVREGATETGPCLGIPLYCHLANKVDL